MPCLVSFLLHYVEYVILTMFYLHSLKRYVDFLVIEYKSFLVSIFMLMSVSYFD